MSIQQSSSVQKNGSAQRSRKLAAVVDENSSVSLASFGYFDRHYCKTIHTRETSGLAAGNEAGSMTH